jgi:hypothetical protein
MSALLATEATPTTAGQEVPAKQSTEQGAPAGDAKPADSKDTKSKSDGPPEAYEFKTPKGLPDDYAPDDKVLASFTEKARELGLSQEKAQQMLDYMLPTMHGREAEQQVQRAAKWADEARNDKEIGGKNLDASLADSQRALKAFGTPELQKLLDGPMGNHPEVIRVLAKIGKTVKPDGFVSGNSGNQSFDPNDDAGNARRLYPNG